MKKVMLFVMCIIIGAEFIFAGGSKEGSTIDTSKKSKPNITMIIPGLNDNDTVDPITGIKTLGLGSFEDIINKQVDDANVHVISIPWDGWIQKMEATLTSGEADIGFYTNQVAVPDWFTDLTPYLQKDSDLNFENIDKIFTAPVVANLPYKSFNYPEATGKIYGIPIEVSNYDIVYDTKLFDQWGMDYPKADTTYHELVEMAQKMTGKNPVTGEQNYGAYVRSYWMEWNSISYDAVKSLKTDDMDINNFDIEKYVEYMKDSPEILQYFKDMETLVSCSPKGITTDSGSEKFLTEDNNIAINFDTNRVTSPYLSILYAGLTDLSNRFQLLLLPVGPKSGMQGFPEFYKIGVGKGAKNPDLTWSVLKKIVTDPTILNFYTYNYAKYCIPAIKDSENFDIFNYPINKPKFSQKLSH